MAVDSVILFIVGVITITTLLLVGVNLVMNYAIQSFINQFYITFSVTSGLPDIVALQQLTTHGVIQIGVFSFTPSVNTDSTFFVNIKYSTTLLKVPTSIFVTDFTNDPETGPYVKPESITKEGFSIYFTTNLFSNSSYSYELTVSQ